MRVFASAASSRALLLPVVPMRLQVVPPLVEYCQSPVAVLPRPLMAIPCNAPGLASVMPPEGAMRAMMSLTRVPVLSTPKTFMGIALSVGDPAALRTGATFVTLIEAVS
jgi:hypothetical protein